MRGIMPGPVMRANVCDISGSGMRLRTPLPLPCGTPVEIEAHEMLTLGSVCRCVPDKGSYTIGIQISETGRLKKTLMDAQQDGAKGPA